MALRRQGARSVMLFLAQRGDCLQFEVAGDIDPAYAAQLIAARAAGVEILAYGCRVSPEGIELADPLSLVVGSGSPLLAALHRLPLIGGLLLAAPAPPWEVLRTYRVREQDGRILLELPA